MLSELFEEEAPMTAAFVSNHHSLVSKPRSPRPSCNLVGLDNQGSTCYLNSLIQQLFLTPEFLQGLFAIPPDHLGVGGPEWKVRTLPVELQRLFTRMLLSDESAVSTADLTRSFGWNSGEETQQHDVQELNRLLFAAIEASLVGLKGGEDLIGKFYRGTLVNQIRCLQCGVVSEREEEYQDLCVPVAGLHDLPAALVAAYVDTETLEGDNAYRCEACDSYVRASKGAKIRSLPPLLTLSLLRFNFDLRRMERYKETGRFEFPTTLDMAPFVECVPDDAWAADYVYDLVGVVIHRGSGFGGHYHAYLRDCLGIGVWSPPEAEPVRMPDPARTDMLEVDSPVEMLRVILSQSGESGLQVDKLGSEIVRQTGVSWNKRFRQRHGQLIKFIRGHDSIFGFNPDSRWAWLLPNAAETPQPAADLCQSVYEASGDAGDRGWFDFNDARVSPIRAEAIRGQFEGRESAYLLTYRLKKLEMESGRERLKAPEWLTKEVEKENEELRKARQEYDDRIHRITVSVLQPPHVSLHAGSLQLLDAEDRCEVRIDCRQALKHLLSQIETQAPFVSLLWRGTECAYFIKTELRECDPDTPVNQVGVCNGATLLLWNGRSLNGVEWPHCREIPFRLLLDCRICSPDISVRIHGSQTPLWLCICEHWPDLDPSGIFVYKLCFDDDGNEVAIPLLTDELSRSAEELGLSGDVRLLISDFKVSSSQTAADVKPSSGIRHSVFHAPVKNRLSPDEDTPRFFVPFSAATTVLAFRREALRCCGFNAIDAMVGETRLRIAIRGDEDPQELGPPLLDQGTLFDSGWDSDNAKAYLVLERGEPVASGQLFLTVLAWDMSAECSVVVSEMASVGQLKESAAAAVMPKQAVDQLSLQHLTWCDDPGPTYKDEVKSLSSSGVCHGDRLLLQKARQSPAGTVCFPVLWRHVTPPNCWRFDEEETQPKMLSSLTLDHATPVSELRKRVAEELGEAEERLRLRVWERGRSAAVLKSDAQSVQRARIGEGRPLCVEIVPTGAAMEPSEILLLVRLFELGTRRYSSPREVRWRPEEALPSQLHAHLCSQLRLSPGTVAFAKQLPERHQWLPIPTQDSTQAGQGGRKRISMLKAPYGLRDGDTIGVLPIEAEHQATADEFLSAHDAEAKRKAEEEAAERRKNRQPGVAEKSSYRPVEVPLVIHVKRFS